MRDMLFQLHMEQFEVAMSNAGLRCMADLAGVTSPDVLPLEMPRATRNKLAAHLEDLQKRDRSDGANKLRPQKCEQELDMQGQGPELPVVEHRELYGRQLPHFA